jgi:hypothetical protein
MKRKEIPSEENSQNNTKKSKKQIEILIDQNITRTKSGKSTIAKIQENFGSSCTIQTNEIINSILFKLNDQFIKKIIYLELESEKFINGQNSKFNYFKSLTEKNPEFDFLLILEKFKHFHQKIRSDIQTKLVQNKPVHNPVNVNETQKILAKLQIELNINIRETNNEMETSDFIIFMIMNLTEENEKESNILDFKKSNSTKNPFEAYKAQLTEIQLSEVQVEAIVKKYPTLKKLTDVYYDDKKSENEKKNLLKDIECVYLVGQNRTEETRKKLGKAASEKVYNFYKE